MPFCDERNADIGIVQTPVVSLGESAVGKSRYFAATNALY